jgi:transposase
MSQLKSHILSIGIDVSKAKLDIAFKFNDSYQCFLTENTRLEIKKLISRIKKLKFTGKIIIESTAHYHYLATFLLSEAGFDVRLINPLLTKQYNRSKIRKVKTDKSDSQLLANIAILEENLPLQYQPKLADMQIRLKIGLLCSLEKQIQVANATLQRFQQSQELLNLEASKTETNIMQTYKQLIKQKEQLEKEVISLVRADFSPQTIQNLESIPGISSFMSCLILFCLNPILSVKSWIGFIGLDVSTCQSGTWTGRGKLTKRGNPYLRKRLFLCAAGAVFHYPDFRALYDSIKAKGRKHTEALNIIARKLLKIAHAVLANNTRYEIN